MKSLQNSHNFIKLGPKKKKKADSSSWALSYGDMVTALLCFFIIFYALEKQAEKRLANPVKGYAQTEGILQEHKAPKLDTDYDYAIEALENTPGIEVMRSSSFVDILFKKTVFFEKGRDVLTADGKALLDQVMNRITKIQGKYILEIQGHADSTPVIQRKNRWWKSNMELSVLRALSVHGYLAEHFLDKNTLIVSGQGNLKNRSDQENDPEDINRRISLRLQLVK